MDDEVFHYQPACSADACTQPAEFKTAAPWSDGTRHELKNYGLACLAHREVLLERARRHRQALALAEGETLGPIGLYRLINGSRDSELSRQPDSDPAP